MITRRCRAAARVTGDRCSAVSRLSALCARVRVGGARALAMNLLLGFICHLSPRWQCHLPDTTSVMSINAGGCAYGGS